MVLVRLLKNQLTVEYGFISGLSSIPSICVYPLCQSHVVLFTVNLYQVLKLGIVGSQLFFFKLLSNQGLFQFHMNFRISLSDSPRLARILLIMNRLNL